MEAIINAKSHSYYWLKVDEVADWQIVEVGFGKVRWFRAGKLAYETFNNDYPNAQWGDRVERKSIHMPSRVMPSRASAAVYSHPACPFHYCDQPAPHEACKLRGGCRHNPTEGNHG